MFTYSLVVGLARLLVLEPPSYLAQECNGCHAYRATAQVAAANNISRITYSVCVWGGGGGGGGQTHRESLSGTHHTP